MDRFMDTPIELLRKQMDANVFAPLTINAAAGVEEGAFGDGKIDWSLGGIYALDRFDLGLTYVDSARTFGADNFGPKLVFSLSSTF